ncbi:MAG: hypothetical protein ACE5F5_09530 [Acidimicrobiia bacterium]
MTWAERFGDLATNVALVLINALRIITLLVSIAADKVDGFVTSLAERSEGGISPASGAARGWLSLPASVAWGIAAIALRAISVVTVFLRQAAATIDGFLEALSEGPEEPQPSYTAPGTAA